MPEITMVVWIITAAGGLTLAGLWVARGGLRQAQDEGEVAERRKGVVRGADETPGAGDPRETEPAEAPGVSLHRVVPHAALGVAGLALWIGYVLRPDEPGMRLLPLVALVILAVAGGFGVAMFRRWLVSRRVDHPAREPERRLPPLLVALYGVGALTTFGLVVAVTVIETWPLFRDMFAGVRDPELETLAWIAGWVGIGVAAGVVLHLAFGRRRERRPPGATVLLTATAALVGGGFGYFLLGLTGSATLVLALGGALLSSWGRTFGYAIPAGGRA